MKVAVALLGYAGSLGLFAVSFFGYAFNRYGSTGIENDLGSDTVQMLGWLGVGMSLILFVLTAIASAMLDTARMQRERASKQSEAASTQSEADASGWSKLREQASKGALDRARQ